MEISHENSAIILQEKDKYDRMKYELISENENNNIRLSYVQSFFKK